MSGLPGDERDLVVGTSQFRAGKRIFSAFEIVKGRPSIAFRLEATEVKRLLRGENFFATPYGQGRWASMWVDSPVDWRLVARLVERSYRIVANKRMLTALMRPHARVGSSSTGRE